MNKKIVLVISIIGTLVLGLLAYLEKIGFYHFHPWTAYILGLLYVIGPSLFLFPIILIFSLITYKMNDGVFKLWLKFTYIWIPLTIILPILTPIGGGGGYVLSIDNKASVWLIMSVLFFIISLIIILAKSLSSKKQ